MCDFSSTLFSLLKGLQRAASPHLFLEIVSDWLKLLGSSAGRQAYSWDRVRGAKAQS